MKKKPMKLNDSEKTSEQVPYSDSTNNSSHSKTSKSKNPRRSKQPQERYGACPAILNPDAADPGRFANSILFSKAVLNESHYGYFYYNHKALELGINDSSCNWAKVTHRLPDILYS